MSGNFQIVITVDVEGVYGTAPFDHMILGALPGMRESFGVPMIMNLCDKHRVKATFFVDVYEYRLHGEEPMARLVREIHSGGHDVQLHTHPAWPLDSVRRPRVKESAYSYRGRSPSKPGMTHYKLEEQVGILLEGIQKLESWTGERPIAHRAGGYAADYDTLGALSEVGIPVDASMFFRHDSCYLNDPVLTRNRVVHYTMNGEGVVEVPVTCFERRTGGYAVGPLCYDGSSQSAICKVDIDWCGFEELKKAISLLRDNGVNPVTVFLHSFTFLTRDNKGHCVAPDYRDIEKFDALLGWITSHPDWEVVTMKQIAGRVKDDPKAYLDGSDSVPAIVERKGYIELLSYSVRAYRSSWKARVYIAVHLLFLLLLCIMGFVLGVQIVGH